MAIKFSTYRIPKKPHKINIFLCYNIICNSSIGIPCLFHFFILMVSIVISIIFSRVRVRIQKHFLLLPEQITLLRLSNEEILVFDSYIKTDNIIISSFINDPLMNKLKQKIDSYFYRSK